MLHRLDTAILNRLDKITTYAQRRGFLLTNIHVGVCGTVLLLDISKSMIPSPDPVGVGLATVVWGSWLFAYLMWANKNKDYPSSSRMMERLNASAVSYRESEFFVRMIWLFLLVILLIVDGLGIFAAFRLNKSSGEILSFVFNIMACACANVMWYLNGCVFLGPGHFAKDRKTSFIANPISLRG